MPLFSSTLHAKSVFLEQNIYQELSQGFQLISNRGNDTNLKS